MQDREFYTLLLEGGAAVGASLPEGQCELLFRYFQELKRWSAKVNLIARETDDRTIVEKHFVDSLSLLSLFGTGDHLLDIGTGAGFPGLVCKIAGGDVPVGLIEPRLKRVSFLRQVIRVCELKGVEVIPMRLEQGVVIPGESEATAVVSRAVTDIAKFLALCDRFCRPGCRVICMKGPNYAAELDELAESSQRWKCTARKRYELPVSGSSRILLVFERRLTDGEAAS